MPNAKLTPAFTSKATCDQGKAKTTYFDQSLKGFILEVRKSGGKTFYLRYQSDRKTRLYKLGDAQALSANDARAEAKKIKSKIELGYKPHTEKLLRQSTPTLDEFYLEHYLPHIKQRNRSWKTNESVFINHILPKLGSLLMSDITRYAISQLHTQQLEKGFKPATANKLPTYLRVAFNLAIKWQIPGVTVNPASNCELFAENNKIERYLTKIEAKRLMSSVVQSENKMLKYIVTFLLLTGARRNECLHAKWEDFDFVAMTWTIPLSKSGSVHHVPVTTPLLNLLNTVPRSNANPFVFPNAKTGEPYVTIFTAWNRARKKAGLSDVRLHDLRHTYASTLVNSGRSLYEVQALLGHANIAVTQRYAHLSNDSLMAAASCAGILVPALSVLDDN